MSIPYHKKLKQVTLYTTSVALALEQAGFKPDQIEISLTKDIKVPVEGGTYIFSPYQVITVHSVRPIRATIYFEEFKPTSEFKPTTKLTVFLNGNPRCKENKIMLENKSGKGYVFYYTLWPKSLATHFLLQDKLQREQRKEQNRVNRVKAQTKRIVAKKAKKAKLNQELESIKTQNLKPKGT